MTDDVGILDSSNWYLEAHQQKSPQYLMDSILRHVEEGSHIAATDPTSLLVFSGGQTRKSAGKISEAESYVKVGQANDWFGHGATIRHRIAKEEFARNSLENLMFPLCVFRSETGRYPEHITMIGFEHKRLRFEQNHAHQAMQIPSKSFTYVGVDGSGSHIVMQETGIIFEEKLRDAFRQDPYACNGFLKETKSARDPFNRGSVNSQYSCGEMSDLLNACDILMDQNKNVRDLYVPWK